MLKWNVKYASKWLNSFLGGSETTFLVKTLFSSPSVETLIFMLTCFASAIPCLPPPDITDGSHNGQSGEEFSFGSAVTYKCDPGFSLIGEASIHCTTKDQVNGEWSGPAPECKG